MTGNKPVIVIAAIATVLGVLSAAPAASAHSRNHVRGFVVPCSLDGVNPVYHPQIFGDPTAAADYGFVRVGGTWRVRPDCHR